MTVEERMSRIDERIQKEEDAVLAAEEAAARKHEECIQKIKALAPRIKDVLKLANYAESKGISLHGKKSWGGHEGYDTGLFYSNGWSHLVGIMDERHLGIRKGGACGNINFLTDGEDVVGYDTSSHRIVAPLTHDMENFLKKFDEFEKCLFEFLA